jgi:hypothetical protein
METVNQTQQRISEKGAEEVKGAVGERARDECSIRPQQTQPGDSGVGTLLPHRCSKRNLQKAG